jgi:pimeloyl-ACP methyl ester carboxylesterase
VVNLAVCARRGRWLACALLPMALLLALVAVPRAALAAPVVVDGIAGTHGAAVPQLEWGPCPAATPEEAEFLKDYQCTTAEVPLSYRDPDGQSLELALGKLPAADPSRRLGTLFWNPGGPGGSGRIPPIFSEALHERFDLVGFDPRGIAASTPLQCFTSNEQAVRLFGSEFPITLAQEQDFIRRNSRGTQLCGRNGGPILEHMSTANVARDLDLLRQAVGDLQLTYLGYSYGTAVGEYYANLFPDNVRALTLDAVIDPIEWTTGRTPQEALVPVEYRLGSFFGANQALNTFLAECARDARCAFREPGMDLRRKYNRLLARLRRAPVEVTIAGETFLVNYQAAVYATLGALYFAPNAPFLAEGLQTVWQATEQPARRRAPREGLGTGLRPSRAPAARQDEPYFGLEWFTAVECTDSSNPSNPWLWPRYARRADRQAGPFGSPWIYGSMPCATWPASDPDRYTGPWNRPTANPILLIGNRQGDPATPYEDAQSTEQELANARLLTLDSFGHTAQGGLSRCIDDAVDSYLIEKRLPPAGQICQPDRRPFDPVPPPVARRQEEREQRIPHPPVPLVAPR